MTDERIDHQPWPFRATLLLVLGALIGLAVNRLAGPADHQWTEDSGRLAAASFLCVGGIVFAVSLERLRWAWAVVFALLCGAVVAGVFTWHGSPERWDAGEGWRLTASLLAIAIAAPFFQTMRDAGRWRLDYRVLHGHAWTNVVLWFAAWAFVLLVFLLAHLLGGLFDLIGIKALSRLLDKGWFMAMLVGGALGAAIGLFRDRVRVIDLLQRVITAVLSVLAPILALGVVLFVVALPFTGLAPLWKQTSATTPILLSAIVAALILANAVIGNSAGEEAPQRVLKVSAMALGAVMLPLAIVAAISTGKRIGQYGFTPDRLWALTFVLIALAYALGYAFALLRGRMAWAERARPANIVLGLGLCGLALLLATPLVDFGAISTRDQLARLESGKVKAEDFDWGAMAFDFGPKGRTALARLRDHGPAALREKARDALALKNRWEADMELRARRQARSIRVLPKPAPIPEALGAAIVQAGLCAYDGCALLWTPGGREAIVVHSYCDTCGTSTSRLTLDRKGLWLVDYEAVKVPSRPRPVESGALPVRDNIASGSIEIRDVTRRQVFVDGRPVGGVFD